MKKLYIRFFRNKEDQIPVNSYHICSKTDRPEIIEGCISAEGESVAKWLALYDNGKTDFVWLS